MTVTKSQVAAAIRTIAAVAETIRELGSVPSGHLYAQLMPTGMTLQTYQFIIDKLKGAGLIDEKNHLISWVLPEPTDVEIINRPLCPMI